MQESNRHWELMRMVELSRTHSMQVDALARAARQRANTLPIHIIAEHNHARMLEQVAGQMRAWAQYCQERSDEALPVTHGK